MIPLLKPTDPVLLVGESELIASTAVCLVCAGHSLTVCTPHASEFKQLYDRYANTQVNHSLTNDNLQILTALKMPHNCKLAIIITREDEHLKKDLLNQLDAVIASDVIVAVNTESITLEILQNSISNINRLIGLNWTEPVHTSFFLEVIAAANSDEAATAVSVLAKLFWSKDPYIVKGDGIRSRLLSAMAREASFLVDNGYASVDDIDRACRNDAGYYLPFCGNLRYMDLMGTYAYGMVMKGLNPDLSKDTALPDFMTKVLEDGGVGMKNRKGFYNYTDTEVELWKETMDKFSYQIQSLIEKYPFNYNKENLSE
jgi:3-hydroxybutyryl-CoA dehydrogenase